MRFLMKTYYYQDIRLFKYRSTFFWYLALVAGCFVLPVLLDEYLVSQLNFIAMYSIAAVGLMLLTGYTGQVSMGHAAFFAIGSYTSAILTAHGVPFVVSLPLAGVVAGIIGVIMGRPILHLTGLYLAIATMGFAFIVNEVLVRWESLTKGNLGYYLSPPSIGPFIFDTERRYYYLSLVVLILTLLAARNILRAPLGRAMIAIRDSEIASEAMGISPAKFKTMSFAVSAFFTGVAGYLYAHKILFINPESYTIILSVELLAMVIIGGLGSLPRGRIRGDLFYFSSPTDHHDQGLYAGISAKPNRTAEPALFGLLIILVMLLEPLEYLRALVKNKILF